MVTDTLATPQELAVQRQSSRPGPFRKLIRQPKGVIGLVLVGTYVFLALFGPLLVPLDPYVQNFGATLQPPSLGHWFGTDQLGRDVFSRILAGSAASIGIGLGSVALGCIFGVPLGLLAAWRRGKFDAVVMRFVDIMLSFPDIVFALAIVAVLRPSTQNVIIAVGVVSIPVFVRTSRAVALSTIKESFVEGSTALGCAPSRVLFRHVLPNMMGILVTLASLMFASNLLSASGLGFLGLGVQPPESEWGAMLGESRSYILSNPYLATFPGLFLAIAALGFNLLGEALRAIYDPSVSRMPRRYRVAMRLSRQPKTATSQKSGVVVRAEGLEVSYLTEKGPLAAVRRVDVEMQPGRTLALVGESGSGKSTLLRAIATLLPEGQAAITAGKLRVCGRDVASLSGREIRNLRRSEIGIVFQDASSALNPVMTIGEQLIEAIRSGNSMSRNEARKKAVELLLGVQISDPEKRLDTYPHQFSGGMKQRIVIAIALAQSPKLLLADEPTSALDVTIQQQILTLLRTMQREREMAMLLVTHDLGLVARYADDVAVMYAGEIVEKGTVEEVFGDPHHPYTRALRLSSPKLCNGSGSRLLPSISGEPPVPGNLSSSCSFAPRCPKGRNDGRCHSETPEVRLIVGRMVACHYAGAAA